MVVHLARLAAAHPPADPDRDLSLKSDAWERVVDIALQGPMGCFESHVAISWEHRWGNQSTSGSAETLWRLDHRVWRLDAWDVAVADARSLEVRLAPQLLGTSIEADLAYPMARGRIFRWPQPVSTLPGRLFGQVQSISIDELPDGGRRVVEAFVWDGWKEVEGEIAVTVSKETVPIAISVDATDRWPDGCKVRSEGELSLSGRGLPSSERWQLSGSCPLRDWSGVWSLTFSSWRPCPFSGPSRLTPL